MDPLRLKKERIREEIWRELQLKGLSPDPAGRIPTFEGQNRAAQRLRTLDVYRRAKRLLVPPDTAQLQVRINAILDGKTLVLATPGLRRGFCGLSPQDIPIPRLKEALRAGGIAHHTRSLETSSHGIGKVDLLVTGAVAVDPKGNRLGKGKGFFDLEYAILLHLGCINEDTPVVGIVHDAQVLDEVPAGEGDVSLDWIVTPESTIQCHGKKRRPRGIPWKRLTPKEIRRIKPLFRIWREMGESEETAR